MQRVWNITDGSRFKGPARVMMLMGKTVDPGRFVTVPEDRIKKAHKLAADVANGAAHIGQALPDWYVREKTTKHVPFPVGHNRAHGAKLESSPTLKKEVDATVEKAVEQVTTPAETTPDSPADSSDDSSSEGLFGRKRHRRG